MPRQMIGSKGGGGGSSFVTKPDTLRSDDNFEILLGLGSGRWKGLTNGLQSLKLNGVTLENDDGSSNFEDVFMIFADGNPLEDQLVNFQLGGGGNTQTINTQLVNTTGTGVWISGSVSTPNANYIDIRFLVSSLFYQDEKSIRENTANIEIEMRASGTSDWVNIFTAPTSSSTTYDPNGYSYVDDVSLSNLHIYLSQSMFNSNGTGFSASSNPNLTITGKTTSPYVKELRVAVPNTGAYANKTWEVRARLVELDTVDNDDIQERRVITLETIAAVITDQLGDDPEWDGLVWAQIHGKASDQFSGFPEITGVFDTKICQVPGPSVFDPDTRVYTQATWDGTYVEAFTTDPAWQIKEFVEDPEHGIAGLLPGATLDKWDALEASKYFSEQVPDGQGGTHPRFSMNLVINEAKDIDEMMSYLAGAVNSYTEDVGGGTWRFKVDKPENPVMLFTEDNVFGEFQYSHSDIDTRFNDWRGTFLDESLDYETNTVRVFDQADIDKNGIKFTEVALVGCTHPQEALRRLMFRLRVSLNEFRSVSFQTNRIGRLINPLDTILVADGSLNPDHLVKTTSRMKEHNGTTVRLLRELRLETGVSYTVHFSTTDGGTISRTVNNTAQQRGDVLTLYIDSALPADVMAQGAVALEATGLAALPVAYRVLSIEKADDDEDAYTINAVQIDSGKWAAMDNVSQSDIYAQEAAPSIDSPTLPSGGPVTLLNYSTDTQNKTILRVDWERPSSLFFDHYSIEQRLNDGPWITLSTDLRDSYIELQNPEDGTYDFKITAHDRRNLKSNPLVVRTTVDSTAAPGASLAWSQIVDDGNKPEDGADVSAYGTGPATASYRYNEAGTAEGGEFPDSLTYRFQELAGPVTSGVTWTYTVLSGNVNGNSADPDTSYSMSGSGSGTLTVNSIGAGTNKIEVQGVKGGKTVRIETVLTREVTAGSSSGGASTSQNSGFTSTNSTSFTTISQELEITLVGNTLDVLVNLRSNYDFEGSGTFEMNIMRWDGAAWVQMGATESRSAFVYTEVEPPYEGGVFEEDANFVATRSFTGTTGATHKVRIDLRIASGDSGSVYNVYTTGSVGLSG